MFSESCYLECNQPFSIDLELNGRPFSAKLIGKLELQSKFGLKVLSL